MSYRGPNQFGNQPPHHGIPSQPQPHIGPISSSKCPLEQFEDVAKKVEDLEIKAGVVEGKVSSKEEIEALAKLPSREGLLSMLLSVLQAPVRYTALAIKAVADQKDGAAA